MIKSFRNKALGDLWTSGRSAKIDARMHKRLLVRLTALDAAGTIADVDHPGYNFHALKGSRPVRYTVHVNGPWCITFEFSEGNVYGVDLEQYH